MARTKKGAPATVEAVEAPNPVGVVEVIAEAVPYKSDKYVVAWPIKVDGRRYAPGETVVLTDDQAAPFLSSGAVSRG